MTDEPDNIVLNILREMRMGIADLRQGQKQTNERLTAIEHHVAGLVHGQMRFNDDVDGLRERVTRIERRLELAEEPTDDAGQ